MLLQVVAKDACEDQKGAWADPEMLTGYEFRMCVRLYDITKKNELYGLQECPLVFS